MKLCETDFPTVLDNEPFRQAWDQWRQHRREIKHALTPSCERLQLRRMEQIGLERAIAAIEYSIEKGWQGLFEPKVNGSLSPGMQALLWREELMRVERNMKDIRDSYCAHQDWDAKDRQSFRELKVRRRELLDKLGMMI